MGNQKRDKYTKYMVTDKDLKPTTNDTQIVIKNKKKSELELEKEISINKIVRVVLGSSQSNNQIVKIKQFLNE